MNQSRISGGLGALSTEPEKTTKSRFHKTTPEMASWLKYKRLTPDKNAFIQLEDGTYAELLAVEGIGLATLPEGQVEEVIDGFANFWRHYLEDVNIITTPFPATTTNQQIFWHQRFERAQAELRKTTDPRRRRTWLARQRYSSDRIKAAKAVEAQLQNQEYMMVFFGKTLNELHQLLDSAYQDGGHYLQFRRLSRERKKLMLFRINNLNVKV
ncbi:hypothetical protein [uncultured Secundilactobacillus sp.]|uniref:hypothetical protein n=1 Tax=uncultured Secundilactobacillus sp. TaxID=2813935 RepID=UPI002586B597|nr:hypothetical protein [uncultured Secundilactobacillus sp.]